MKKILSIIIFILLATPTWSWAYNCAAQVGGVDTYWTTAGNWTNCNGTYPQAGDNVDLLNVSLTWNYAAALVIPDTGSLGTITASSNGTGQLSIDLSDEACHGDETCKITATSITAGYKPTNAGMIYITGTGTISDHILGIHANLVGGGNSSAYAVNLSSTGAIHITGTVTGGTSTSAAGFFNGSTGTFVITGAVTGGSSSSMGVYNTSTGTGTINGDVTGGTGARAYGVEGYGAGAVTLNGNLINATAVAWAGKSPTWTVSNAAYYLQLSTGTKLYADTDPGVANVKKDTTYYFQSGTVKTGTYEAAGGASAYAY
jgi:hypothetical protein